jgi:hypothetical protein
VDPADIRTGDRDGKGVRLHINAYHALRFTIHAHMQSRALPVLEESTKPTGGYEAAIARDGALKQVILSNTEYIKNVRASHIPFQLLIVEDFTPD